MVLLDVARQVPGVQLIVAHVDHGIRKDATMDAELVKRIAMSYNLSFESIELHLGRDTSEEKARRLRYDFLRQVCKKYNASAILTAHHKDDLLETAIINILRGTGWRGLDSLRSTPKLIRPFLGLTKAELVAYAQQHHLQWRHDKTNDDTSYLRNRIRHEILAVAPAEFKEQLYSYIVRQDQLTDHIDHEVGIWLRRYASPIYPAGISLPRYHFIMMPRNVAHELLQSVLRRCTGKSVPRPLAKDALVFVCVAKGHKVFELDAAWQLRALSREVIVEPRAGVVS